MKPLKQDLIERIKVFKKTPQLEIMESRKAYVRCERYSGCLDRMSASNSLLSRSLFVVHDLYCGATKLRFDVNLIKNVKMFLFWHNLLAQLFVRSCVSPTYSSGLQCAQAVHAR